MLRSALNDKLVLSNSLALKQCVIYSYNVSFAGKSTNGEDNGWSFKDYIWFLLVAVFGGFVALTAFRLVLAQIGFTVVGVAANSMAALIQSVVYGGAVGATSIFAVLQSIGAAGLSTRAGLVIFMAGAVYALWFFYPRE